jgi:hypothetical protein
MTKELVDDKNPELVGVKTTVMVIGPRVAGFHGQDAVKGETTVVAMFLQPGIGFFGPTCGWK